MSKVCKSWISRAFCNGVRRKRAGKQVDALSTETANEAHGDVEARLDHVVERQKDRRVALRLGMSERNVKFSRRVAYYDLATFGVGPVVVNRADCRRRKWRRGEGGRRLVSRKAPGKASGRQRTALCLVGMSGS